MTVAGKTVKHLLRSGSVVYDEKNGGNPELSERRWVQIARIAGLLHDIGHGPFSHAFDRIVYSKIYNVNDGGHDHHRLRLIQQSPLKQCIEGCDVKVDDILRVWTAKQPEPGASIEDVMFYMTKLAVGGPLGADRIDFVLRDSYFTGTKHLGTIAWKRIIYNSTILFQEKTNRFVLAYAYKTIHDIIQALDGRRYMYHGVYLNKTVEAASLVIEKMMEHLEQYKSTKDKESFANVVQDSQKFALLNDNTVIGQAINLDPSEPARQWCERLLKRKLPKRIKEQIVDGRVPFNANAWKNKWFGGMTDEEKDNIIIRSTRCITGIDPFKFRQYSVLFYKCNKNGEKSSPKTFGCETALENAHFKSISPYYLVRAYKIEPLMSPTQPQEQDK